MSRVRPSYRPYSGVATLLASARAGRSSRLPLPFAGSPLRAPRRSIRNLACLPRVLRPRHAGRGGLRFASQHGQREPPRRMPLFPASASSTNIFTQRPTSLHSFAVKARRSPGNSDPSRGLERREYGRGYLACPDSLREAQTSSSLLVV